MTKPFEEGEIILPSPNQLKYRIIIKNKKLPESDENISSSCVDEADSDFEDEQFNNELSSGIIKVHTKSLIINV